MKTVEILTIEDTIEDMVLDYGVRAIDVYLDACTIFKRLVREKYVKTGEMDTIDYDHMIDAFMMVFEGGISKYRFFYDDLLSQTFMMCYYLELKKIGAHDWERNRILDILAFNGSGESEAYSMIANDKIAGDK